MIFQQLFERETFTYTYIVGCPRTLEAVIIDPVLEMVDRDLQLLQDLQLKLVYILDTHVHADHVTAAGEMRKRLGATTAVSEAAKVDCADIALKDNQVLRFGDLEMTALSTPGHTDSCMSFWMKDRVFTGDTLLIRGCGRTDFQDGSAARLFESIQQKLFILPDATLVFPGHDYRGLASTTIGTEKRLNPRLGAGRSKEEFEVLMSDLKLAHPKNLAAALPLNRACGIKSI